MTSLPGFSSGGGSAPSLETEAYMLRYLWENSPLPVPEVLYSDPTLLVMTYLENGGGLSPRAEADAADHIAALHDVEGRHYGFEEDTLIGPLEQPNPLTSNWTDFFRDERLLYMADEAGRSGRLDAGMRDKIERLAAKLESLIGEPPHPSLLHGDLWTGNVLVDGDKIAGFVDPAIYWGHPEMDLAFSTLFGTFGKPFFDRYAAQRPIAPGFFETRRDLYNLYPLLVHVRLFGGSYAAQVDRIVSRFV